MIDQKILDILAVRFGDLSKITGDDLRAYVAEVARSYIGAKEGGEKHLALLAAYNTLDPLPRGHRMTKTEPWCAAACVAWSILAGVAEIVPKECSCSKLIEQAKTMGVWIEDDKHKPRVGEWCVYDWEDDGKGDCTGAPEHIGIVTRRGQNGFTVTEGNNNDQVKDRPMQDDGKFIRGFIDPDYDGMAKNIRLTFCVAGFEDVPKGVYYENALVWAKAKELVFGVADGLFAPDKELTRAEAVAMLHRIWCVAQPTGVELPFEDVGADDWYVPALEWAYDRGVVFGKNEVEFDPDAPVLRCELAVMLWRLAASPEPSGTNCPFEDVPAGAWYGKAVTWAWENGIAEGVGGHRFAPVDGLLRRDAVCLIYRWYTKVV